MSTISQRSIRDRRIAGKAGMLAVLSLKRNRITTGTNSDPQRRAQQAFAITTYTDGANYTLTLEGHDVVYTATTADANTAGVAASLAAAVNADPQVRGLVQAINLTGSSIITIEALLPGLEISASEDDSKISTSFTTTPLQADSIPFGRVLVYAGDSVLDAPDKNKLMKLPDAADLSGEVHVLTPDVQNTTAYDIDIISPTGARSTAAYTSDGSATAQEIVEGQKAAIDALSITGLTTSEDDTALTIELPLGYSLEYSAANYSSAEFTAEIGLDDIFAGISVFTQDEEALDANGNAYAPNSAMDVLEGAGDIFVDSAASVNRNGAVYVELADGDDKGKCFPTSSATRAALSKVVFQESVGDNLAIARVI